MATLPSYRRIYEQDYPQENQALVAKLAVSINNGFDVLYQLLNGKLTLADNTASLIKSVTVTVDSSGNPTTKTTISKPSATSTKYQGLITIQATNLTNSNTYPNGGIFISYTESTDTITINNITGLQAGNSYQLNLLAIK